MGITSELIFLHYRMQRVIRLLYLIVISALATITLDYAVPVGDGPLLKMFDVPGGGDVGLMPVIVVWVLVVPLTFYAIWKLGKKVKAPPINFWVVIAHLIFLISSVILVIENAIALTYVLGDPGSLAGLLFIAFPGIVLFPLFYLLQGFSFNYLHAFNKWIATTCVVFLIPLELVFNLGLI